MVQGSTYREALDMITMLYPGKATLSPAEVAKLLGVSVKTIYRGIEDRKIPCKRITGTKCLIVIPELARWMTNGK
jgi:excisionase family DNA binding protein